MNGLCRNKTESPPSFASSFPAATPVFSFLFPLFLRFASFIFLFFFSSFFLFSNWLIRLTDYCVYEYYCYIEYYLSSFLSVWTFRTGWSDWPTIHRNLILCHSGLVRFFPAFSPVPLFIFKLLDQTDCSSLHSVVVHFIELWWCKKYFLPDMVSKDK